jgi:virulence-associated protein VapD
MHATTEEEWQIRASAFVKAKMKECGVTYAELVKRLEKHGFKETEASITMKLKRGTFAATFLALLKSKWVMRHAG